MKRRKKRSEPMRALRLWERHEIAKAAPYLHSVIGSVREHWVDVLAADQRVAQDAQQKAPLKTAQLIERNFHRDELQRAQDQFEDAHQELTALDVFLLDPLQGLALIPFRKENDLAWYVFDHFSAPNPIGWRLHEDPFEECRPLGTLPEEASLV